MVSKIGQGVGSGQVNTLFFLKERTIRDSYLAENGYFWDSIVNILTSYLSPTLLS